MIGLVFGLIKKNCTSLVSGWHFFEWKDSNKIKSYVLWWLRSRAGFASWKDRYLSVSLFFLWEVKIGGGRSSVRKLWMQCHFHYYGACVSQTHWGTSTCRNHTRVCDTLFFMATSRWWPGMLGNHSIGPYCMCIFLYCYILFPLTWPIASIYNSDER